MLGGGPGRGAEFQAVGAVTSVIVTLIQEAQEVRVKLRLPKKVHQQTTAKVFSHWAKNLVIRRETSHWANNLITNNTIVVLPRREWTTLHAYWPWMVVRARSNWPIQ